MKQRTEELDVMSGKLEDLMNKYDVDIVQTGHLHDYERSWPTYKGKALK
jgi:UDP-2,3-diacylglucosamine pyrophosphatase LpxH